MSTLADPSAELTVLSAAFAQPQLLSTLADLDPDVFTTVPAQAIHRTLVDAFLSEDPRDHATIARRASQGAATTEQGASITRTVMNMIGQGEFLSAGFYLERLLRLHNARMVSRTGARLLQIAEEAAERDDSDHLSDGTSWALGELSGVTSTTQVTDADLPMSLTDLLGKEFQHDWLVPDLIERGDRIILTGLEGTGKSYLVAQMAMAIAAGIHPFLGVPVTGHKQVLVIDAENSERQTSRRYQTFRARMDRICEAKGQTPPDWSQVLRFVIRPEGIPLNNPSTLARIERAIAATRPEFVAIGPLYRLHRLDTRDEQAAKELTDVIDRLRVKYRFAVICEAHVAHGQQGQQRALRPTGSSLFLRWPEFGFGLRPAQGTEREEHPSRVDLATWRGGREERLWPRTLQHGFLETQLPWNNGDDMYLNRARARGIDV